MPELTEVYKKIEDLMTQKFWLEAHRACLEFLKLDPENIRVIRYKNKIEKEVRIINKKAIQEDLENLKPLWDSKKYQDIIDHLEKLRPYQSAFPKLDNLLKKAQKGLKIEKSQQEEVSYQQKVELIGKLMGQKQFIPALQECEKLQMILQNSGKVQKFIRQVKEQYVNAMLESNRSLLQTQKYDDIIVFYQDLLLVHPLSIKVQKLLEQVKRQKHQNIMEEKRDFIYKGLDEIRILYQLKKYEKAFQAAQEILTIDPTNKVAKKWHKASQGKLSKIAERHLLEQIKEQQKKLKEEYKQNRSLFIKI